MEEKTFRTFKGGDISSQMAKNLFDCYRRVFAEPPWNETHLWEVFQERFFEEIRKGILVLGLIGQEIFSFAWGAVIPQKEIWNRFSLSHGDFADYELSEHRELFISELERVVKEEKVIFLDEIGSLKDQRGFSLFSEMLKPIFQMGLDQEIKGVICWTHTNGLVIRMLERAGFQQIYQFPDGMVFFYHPDVSGLTQAATSPRDLAMFILKRGA